MDETELSIVIVSHNTRDLLAECLGSVRDCPPQCGHEVIVVDNASSDDSVEMLQEQFPDVRCVSSDQNLGFGAANNRGVAQAAGRFVLLLNPDTRVDEGSLEAMVSYLRETPDVGVLGCRQVDERGWPQLCYGRDPTILSELMRRRDTLGLARGDERAKDRVDRRYREPTDVDWVTGACMAFPRQVYTRLGGMDEDFWLYFEDADLCRRVRHAGRRVVYHPGITIFHRRDAAMANMRPVSSVAYRVAQLHYARTHRGAHAAFWVRLMVLARGTCGWLFSCFCGDPLVRRWVGRQMLRLGLLGKPGAGWRQGPAEMDSAVGVR